MNSDGTRGQLEKRENKTDGPEDFRISDHNLFYRRIVPSD
jgi:hypothetical protein